MIVLTFVLFHHRNNKSIGVRSASMKTAEPRLRTPEHVLWARPRGPSPGPPEPASGAPEALPGSSEATRKHRQFLQEPFFILSLQTTRKRMLIFRILPCQL